jgi:hypothetical protein
MRAGEKGTLFRYISLEEIRIVFFLFPRPKGKKQRRHY